MKVLFKNCLLANDEVVDILVENEKIIKVSSQPLQQMNAQVYDMKDKLVIPGAYDLRFIHNFIEDKDQADFIYDSKALLKGGITTKIDIPDFPIEGWRFDQVFYNKINDENKYSQLGFAYANTVNFHTNKKDLFISKYTVATFLIIEGFDLDENDSKSIVRFIQHIKLIQDNSNALIVSIKDKNIDLFLKYIKKHDKPIIFTDVSFPQEVTRLLNFKAMGYNFYICSEINTFFIYKESLNNLTEKIKYSNRSNFPSKQQAKQMLKFLNDNKIDIVNANHTSLGVYQKFELNMKGIPNGESYLPLLFNLYSYGKISLETLINVSSQNILKILKLENCGAIKPNYFANLVFVDLNGFSIVTSDCCVNKYKWSPYEGKRLWGNVVLTMYNGSVKYENFDDNDDSYKISNKTSKLVLNKEIK